jgi:hypothetical protein
VGWVGAQSRTQCAPSGQRGRRKARAAPCRWLEQATRQCASRRAAEPPTQVKLQVPRVLKVARSGQPPVDQQRGHEGAVGAVGRQVVPTAAAADAAPRACCGCLEAPEGSCRQGCLLLRVWLLPLLLPMLMPLLVPLLVPLLLAAAASQQRDCVPGLAQRYECVGCDGWLRAGVVKLLCSGARALHCSSRACGLQPGGSCGTCRRGPCWAA